jgi:hypothetical protein
LVETLTVRGVIIASLLVVLAVAAAWTRVFTDGADIVTAIAIVSFLALSVTLRRVPRPRMRARSVDIPRRVRGASVALWTALFAVAVGFELFNYAQSPRHAHPTLSSALAVIATHAWSRGLAFFFWLALGVWIAAS